jgi:hypothetical protein
LEVRNCQQPTIPKLPYDTASRTVAEIAKDFLRKQDPNIVFRLDPETSRLYRLLTLYFTSNPEFESHFLQVEGGKIPYSLRKGNLLIGPTGRSKTFCYEKVFRLFTNRFAPKLKYRVISSHAIQTAFESEGMKALSMFRKNANSDTDNIYIDEIGIEELNVQHFGNKQSPVNTFLHERHRLFTSGGFLTHASSNLKLASNDKELNFKAAYGERTYSRLFEMFNIITIAGPDLRINIIPD